MKTAILKALAAATALATLGACASPTPRLDSAFGHAVNVAKLQQTINPEAGMRSDPVTGIGGVPARETIERYHDSFKAPPPTFEIIFGSGVSAGR